MFPILSLLRASLLRHGLLAGGMAGLLTGMFGFLLGEPLMDQAVVMESARGAIEELGGSQAHHPGGEGVAGAGAEVFTRGQQHVGLLIAALVTGLALGVLFAVAYAVVYRRDPAGDPWRRSLRLAGAAFLGVGLLPFLRYPANPPGVGDAATVGMRTTVWLAAIVLGLAAVAGAWRLNDVLTARGTAEPLRHLAVAAVPVVALAAMFLMPDNPDPLPVPAGMLWTFRVLSALSTALLWTTLGIGFGLLYQRNQRSANPTEVARPAPDTDKTIWA